MSAALRLIFNATALFVLLALAAVCGIAALHGRALPWEQLALGRQIAGEGYIPVHETLLFTAPSGAAFDAGSWVWDWAAWTLGRLDGPTALRAADAAAWLLALWALAATAFRRGARPFSTAVFTAWALLAALPDLAPGPGLAVFSLFCAALWLMEGDFWPAFFGRWLWLAPLAVLAVNVSPAAWALVPLVLIWLFFAWETPEAEAPKNPRFAKVCFFLVLIGCLCLRPQGPQGLPHALAALEASPLLPGAFGPRQGALLLMALSGVLLAASSWTPLGRPRAAGEALLLLVFAAAALATRDALPYFLALAAPVCAARFDILVDALPSPLRALRWPVKVLVFAAVLVVAAPALWRGLPGAERTLRPDQTLNFYRQQVFDENILCPSDWTPYLAWKLAPNARFALDGRGLAEPKRAQALADALQARGDFSGALAQNGVGLCWLPLGSPLALALAASQAWQPLSFDDASVLYVPVTPAHAELIRTLAPRGLRPGDPEQPFDATRLVEAEADLEADLARDPSMGVLYLYMARLWLARGHAAKARETLEGGIRADPAFAPNDALLASLRADMGGATDRAAARILYQRALDLEPRPEWRHALDSLGPA